MRLVTVLIAGALSLGYKVSAAAAEYVVAMVNGGPTGMYEFVPNLVKAQPGDTIRFVAKDKGHNVQSIPGMLPAGAAPFSGGVNRDLSVRLPVPGFYGFKCVPHYTMGMVGAVIVGDPSPNLSSAEHVQLPAKARQRFVPLLAQAERLARARTLTTR